MLKDIISIKRRFEYHPKNRIELQELIKKKGIFLGSIDTSEIEDFSYLFSGARRTDFSGIEYWITSKAISMEGMFSGCKYFNSPIGYWDVSNNRNFSRMFSGCESFNQSLNNWDVSNSETMDLMFNNATSFNQPLCKWDISNNKNFYRMFRNCKNLEWSPNIWRIAKDKNTKDMLSGADIIERKKPMVYNATVVSISSNRNFFAL